MTFSTCCAAAEARITSGTPITPITAAGGASPLGSGGRSGGGGSCTFSGGGFLLFAAADAERRATARHAGWGDMSSGAVVAGADAAPAAARGATAARRPRASAGRE